MARTPTNTKSKIMKAARILYSTHGCSGTTLDDIINSSGVTKGAFYHYFKSKETLCERVLDEVMEDYRSLGDALNSELPAIDQLKTMIQKLTELNASGEWVNCRLMLKLSSEAAYLEPTIKQKVKNFWRWKKTLLEELITKCQQSGHLRNDLNPKMQTELVITVIAGSLVLEKVTSSKPSYAELTSIVLTLLNE